MGGQYTGAYAPVYCPGHEPPRFILAILLYDCEVKVLWGTQGCEENLRESWPLLLQEGFILFPHVGETPQQGLPQGAQTILQVLPGWELWTLRDAPKELREVHKKLRYEEKYRRVCVCCGKSKPPGVTATLDAGQAYEQTGIAQATADFIWCCAYAYLLTGFTTVTVLRGYMGSSRLGGTPSEFLSLSAPVVILEFHEVYQYIWVVLSICFIRCGNSIWKAPGVTIGNPFGRIALAAATTREEVLRDQAWASATLTEEDFDRLSLAGYSREMIFAIKKYVDDASVSSLMACRSCCIRFIQGTYRIGFDPAEDRKLLDMLKCFTRTTPGKRPELVLRPFFKQREFVTGEKKGCVENSQSPWWMPYPVVTLAGIFRGAVLRYRQILPQQKDRIKYSALLTQQYVLRGYELKHVRHSWARTPWTWERYTMLKRLRVSAEAQAPNGRARYHWW